MNDQLELKHVGREFSLKINGVEIKDVLSYTITSSTRETVEETVELDLKLEFVNENASIKIETTPKELAELSKKIDSGQMESMYEGLKVKFGSDRKF